MASFLYSCFSNSLNITFFIILLVLLEPLLKKHFSAVCLYRLWIVILLALVLPIRFANTPEKLREKVVEYAVQAEGTPYLWGGNDLSVGVDCSGLVQAVYKEVGYELPRTSREQEASLDKVSLDDLKPGDLIFYGNQENNMILHVAIYIGEQKVIHAKNMRDGVTIEDYNYRSILSAVRVIID